MFDVSLMQIARAIERDSRRRQQQALQHQRDVAREYRAAQIRHKHATKEYEQAVAASDVFAYDQYVRSLISLHTEGVHPIDWHGVANAQPPAAPVPAATSEAVARQNLAGFRPSLVDRAFGGAKRRVAELEAAIEAAKASDVAAYQAAYSQHLETESQWQYHRALATRVLAREVAAFQEVLGAWEVVSALETFGVRVVIQSIEPGVVQYVAAMDVERNVPNEVLKLTATSKLSRKKMPVGVYWELCQDHVCCAALRLISDTLALLPVDRVIANIGGTALNSSTGHMEPVTWLALHITRSALAKINLHAIDPSDSMVNFQARMNFKKTKGFTPVQPASISDQWVTS